MNPIQANQIAELLNNSNELKSAYTADQLLRYAHEYKFIQNEDTNKVVAVVQIKKVQWYQYEIGNLVVSPENNSKELAQRLLQMAERQALNEGARVLQGTVRQDDQKNIDLFKSSGFKHVANFYNQQSDKNITVWQKILSPIK
jgi:N-acetylglutamate synthase-like GNAT family acetyltransferase